MSKETEDFKAHLLKVLENAKPETPEEFKKRLLEDDFMMRCLWESGIGYDEDGREYTFDEDGNRTYTDELNDG
jgi:hypothetical protein